jgi:hypothetical protein
MSKQPISNLRNGLKPRNGRPRWEPSPTNRKLGIAGKDLKNLDGSWIIDRGKMVSLADARQTWAATYRDALLDGAKGAEARAELTEVLQELPPAIEPEQLLFRFFVADIIEKCRALIDSQPEGAVAGSGRHRISELVTAYFAKPPKE